MEKNLRLQGGGLNILILSRKLGETVVVGDKAVIITVLGVDRGKVRLGFEALPVVPIHRGEVFEKIKEEQHGKSAK